MRLILPLSLARRRKVFGNQLPGIMCVGVNFA